MEGSNSQVCCCRTKLCAGSLAVAFGFTWALGVLILGLLAWKYQYGMAWVNVLSSIYIGFAATTPKAIAIGVAWAFVDAFVCGLVVAWVYNLCCRKCHCKCCMPGAKKVNP